MVAGPVPRVFLNAAATVSARATGLLLPFARWRRECTRHIPAETLFAYLSGGARPTLRAGFEEHLGRCPPCREAAARAAAAADGAGAAPALPLAEAVRREVARMRAVRRSRTRRRALALSALVAILAGALLTLAEPGSPLRDFVGRFFFWAGVAGPMERGRLSRQPRRRLSERRENRGC